MRWARVGVEKCVKFSIRAATLVGSGRLIEDVVGSNELKI